MLSTKALKAAYRGRSYDNAGGGLRHYAAAIAKTPKHRLRDAAVRWLARKHIDPSGYCTGQGLLDEVSR